MAIDSPTNPIIIACKSVDDAQTKAARAGIDSAAIVAPATLFSQAGRPHLSTALPVAAITSRLVGEAPDQRGRGKKKSLQPSAHRPIVKDHVGEIADYLRRNLRSNFVIPPMMVGATEPIQFFTTADEGRLKIGYAVIPAIRLIIIDGAHRHAALNRLLDELAQSDPDARQWLLGESVGVVIRCDADESAVNQAFADSSKCRPLPLALLAPFDLRDPLNRIVTDLEAGCPLLNGRIDATAATLGITASALFTNRQLRAFVQAALTGEPSKGEDPHGGAAKALADSAEYERIRQRLAKFVNLLAAQMEPWNRVLRGEIAVTDVREAGYLNITTGGLLVMGMVLFRESERRDGWKRAATKLAALDWSKDAKLWQGNLVAIRHGKERISTDFKAIEKAVAKIS